ncbi:MAG: branched-chain amino acid ABC transporter permease [Alphaproteobacteria bacterium]|nr:branched-chain amino acid ABC transporter permease [Alphaproteobacteria bacterium]
MEILVSVLADTVLITLVLAFAAFGLAIIYGLTGVINMGHGAMLTLGAYFTWWLLDQGVPFVPTVLLSALAVGLVGLAFEHLLIRHFYGRPFDTLLLTWAFFLVTTEVIKIVFGTDFRNVADPIGGDPVNLGIYQVPTYKTVVALLALAVVAGTALVFFKTTLGVRVRAMTQNREMAGLLGLNVAAMYKLVFGFGAAMAGLAGGVIAPMFAVQPYMGDMFLVRSFFVVTIGGIGQLLAGTLFGSFAIGGLETVLALFSDQVIAQIAVFFIAVIVLRFRPQGVFSGR